METETLLSCMVPPPGYRGDFGYVCGFTAHHKVLSEMVSRFTAGVRLRRVALALFLHPPETHFPVIPGLQILHPRARLDFLLLHAKVALLRFVDGQSSIVRLVVSTGNWTHETLSDSIDLFWMVEWHSASPDEQAASDIVAAAEMFGWLSSRFDTSVLELSGGYAPPREGLETDLRTMRRPRTRYRPRFISNIEDSLLDEIQKRVDRIGEARRNRLIMGSGFFETGNSGVISKIARRLRDAGHLTASAHINVILNPLDCQGLAKQADSLRETGGGTWTFHAPRSQPWQNKLHAKFLFSAGGRDNCTNAWCYLGSGNLTRQGILSKAGSAGNLEAGVVFEPHNLSWEALKDVLPVEGGEVSPGELKQGEDFVPPPQAAMPPISFLEWRNGYLYSPEQNAMDGELTIVGQDGSEQLLPCAWDPAPPSVTLYECRAEVPVWTPQGFVLPPLAPMRIEDILAALSTFPDDPPTETDEEAGSEHWGVGDNGQATSVSTEYPIRRIMRLVTALCDRQSSVAEADWPRWSNRCEELLMSLSKLEAELFGKLCDFGVDPLDALLERSFLPSWLDQGKLLNDHTAMIERVQQAWGTRGLAPLFGSAA